MTEGVKNASYPINRGQKGQKLHKIGPRGLHKKALTRVFGTLEGQCREYGAFSRPGSAIFRISGPHGFRRQANALAYAMLPAAQDDGKEKNGPKWSFNALYSFWSKMTKMAQNGQNDPKRPKTGLNWPKNG